MVFIPDFNGADTPGLTLVKVVAERPHYWDGEEGEMALRLRADD